jgi:VanZ family protein
MVTNIKPHSVKRVNLWMPATGWMLLIFAGSTDLLSAAQTSRFVVPFLLWFGPQISLATITSIHFALRELGHLTEYAVLAALLWCALRSTLILMRSTAIAGLVFFASAVFAASDELHQSFIPSRAASVTDLMIDICGTAIALALCVAVRRRNRPARTWIIG